MVRNCICLDMRRAVALTALLGLSCMGDVTLVLPGTGGGQASGGGAAGGGAATGGGATGGGTVDDAGTDAGLDAGTDAGTDAGIDAGIDAGSTGAFVAVGYGGRRVRSADGTAWTDDQAWEQNGGDDFLLLRAVAYGDGKFDAVGWSQTTSTDGVSWVDGGQYNQWFGGLAWAKGFWVAAGGYGRRSWSLDGLNWTHVMNTDTRAHRALAYDAKNERWIAVGDQGLLVSTFDGGAWDDGNSDAGTLGFGGVCSGAGITVAFSGQTLFVSRNGGLDWEGPIAVSAGLDNCAYGAHQFVAIGSGHAFTSDGGGAWSDHSVPGLAGGLACHGALCVSLSNSHAFRSADDGETWTPVPLDGGTAQWIQAITWGSW